jgi:multidrug resistance efflux pump
MFLVAEIDGQVVDVAVEVGEHVENGAALIRFDSTALEAARAQTLAALEAAQAQLDLLLVEPDESEVEAARAAVAAADAAYKRALEGPSPEEIAIAETQVRQAEAAVKIAQAAFDQVSWNPLIASLPESLQLEQARFNLEEAQANYDTLVNGVDVDRVAAAYVQLAAGRAHLQKLEEGPETSQVRAAEAEVRLAETALFLAQLQLDKATVRAPGPGIVSQVHTAAGTMLVSGAALITLLSPEVKITVPVGEAMRSRVQPNMRVLIYTDAYPNRAFEGFVAAIAPELDPATGTFLVTIRPNGGTAELIPGMIASVELPPE